MFANAAGGDFEGENGLRFFKISGVCVFQVSLGRVVGSVVDGCFRAAIFHGTWEYWLVGVLVCVVMSGIPFSCIILF